MEPRIYTITGVNDERLALTVIAMSADDAIAAFRNVYGSIRDIGSITSDEAPRLTPAAIRWNLERTDRATIAAVGYIEPDIEAQAAAASLARLRELAQPPVKPHEQAIRRADAYNAVHSGVYSAFVPPGFHLEPVPEAECKPLRVIRGPEDEGYRACVPVLETSSVSRISHIGAEREPIHIRCSNKRSPGDAPEPDAVPEAVDEDEFSTPIVIYDPADNGR